MILLLFILLFIGMLAVGGHATKADEVIVGS